MNRRVIVLAPRYDVARQWMRREHIPPERVVYGRTPDRLHGFSPTRPNAPRVVAIATDEPLPLEVHEWIERWEAMGGEIEWTTL